MNFIRNIMGKVNHNVYSFSIPINQYQNRSDFDRFSLRNNLLNLYSILHIR